MARARRFDLYAGSCKIKIMKFKKFNGLKKNGKTYKRSNLSDIFLQLKWTRLLRLTLVEFPKKMANQRTFLYFKHCKLTLTKPKLVGEYGMLVNCNTEINKIDFFNN